MRHKQYSLKNKNIGKYQNLTWVSKDLPLAEVARRKARRSIRGSQGRGGILAPTAADVRFSPRCEEKSPSDEVLKRGFLSSSGRFLPTFSFHGEWMWPAEGKASSPLLRVENTEWVELVLWYCFVRDILDSETYWVVPGGAAKPKPMRIFACSEVGCAWVPTAENLVCESADAPKHPKWSTHSPPHPSLAVPGPPTTAVHDEASVCIPWLLCVSWMFPWNKDLGSAPLFATIFVSGLPPPSREVLMFAFLWPSPSTNSPTSGPALPWSPEPRRLLLPTSKSAVPSGTPKRDVEGDMGEW